MSKINEILGYLDYIKSNNRTISLLSSFKGVTISLDAVVIEIDRRRKTIRIQAHQRQKIPIFPSTQIIMRSVLFPKPVQANVAEVDFQNRTITADNITFASGTIGRRSQARVQSDHTIKARITKKEGIEYTADIADLSLEGISLNIENQKIPPGGELEAGEQLNLFFNLPAHEGSSRTELSLSAKVVYVNSLDSGQTFRVGFQTFPSEDDLNLLRRYIFDRQTAIFNQLSQEWPGG